MSNNSFHCPRSIGYAEGLIGKPECGRLKMSEPNVCSCRHKIWVLSGAKDGNRVAGQVKDDPGTGCLYSWQAGLGQKKEGTHKSDDHVSKITWNSWGEFQWWFYTCRASTWRRREWVTAELATLCFHTDVSFWVSYISWDHFPTTVKLTDFDHRGLYIWYFFSCATLYAGYWFYDQTLKWYLLHWKHRGITTGPPETLDTQGSPGAFIWEIL